MMRKLLVALLTVNQAIWVPSGGIQHGTAKYNDTLVDQRGGKTIQNIRIIRGYR